MAPLYNNGIPEKERRGMIFVEGGMFNMGSQEGESDEMPIHSVFVNSFWLDKFPVTVKEYHLYCGSVGIEFPIQPDWDYNEDLPVVNVTWEEALGYSKWVGKRLPTEAEWEYAANGGIYSKKTIYSGSNNIDEIGWYAKNCDSTCKIGLKKPNELGIYDLSGNVWEWCNDWYDEEYYHERTENNPKGPVNGNQRVLRGGSYFNDSYFLRITNRHRFAQNRKNSMIGFRCAKNL